MRQHKPESKIRVRRALTRIDTLPGSVLPDMRTCTPGDDVEQPTLG